MKTYPRMLLGLYSKAVKRISQT